MVYILLGLSANAFVKRAAAGWPVDEDRLTVLNSFAEAVVTPLAAFALDYAGAQPLPTPPSTQVLSFDLNANGKKDLADIV